MLSKVSEEMWFFMYLLEHYSNYKEMNTGEVLKQWDEKGITQEIYNRYLQYHQERLENAYEDIDALLDAEKHLGTSNNCFE